jgi:hypothetical protein
MDVVYTPFRVGLQYAPSCAGVVCAGDKQCMTCTAATGQCDTPKATGAVCDYTGPGDGNCDNAGQCT